MIDRKKPPKITSDFDLSVHDLRISQLSNGIKLYELNTGSQPILKLDILLHSGRVEEKVIGTAKAALHLLREGSVSKDAEKLAKTFDFYGAVIKNQSSLEHSYMNLVILDKHFKEIWPTWLEMIQFPMYDDRELDKYIQLTVEKMQFQLAQNDVLAYRKITEHIFGAEHPYGYNTEIEHVKALKRDDVLDYYNRNFAENNISVVLSGKYSEGTRAEIINGLENFGRKKKMEAIQFKVPTSPPKKILIETKNKLQASLKIGSPLFDYRHDDYSGFKMLNMVLGGYFGSRLMKNIREEKGYTYGIYSAAHCLDKGGYFYISADVGNEYLDPAISEIFSEMKILKEKPIDSKELEMVRNYVNGQILSSLDGPFAKAQLIRNLAAKGLTLDDQEKHVKKMTQTTAKDLQDLANKYFDSDSYSTVIAGGNTN